MKSALNFTTVLLNLSFALISSNAKNIVGYYAPWGGAAVKDVSLNKMTHVNFAFALAIDFTDPAKLTILPEYIKQAQELVAEAKRVKTTPLISIGGWTGSQTFSLAVRTDENRKKFIESMLYFIKPVSKGGMGFDGLDLDWEYPAQQAAKCIGASNDTYSKADSKNYLLFLKELRRRIKNEFPSEKKLITAAVRYSGFHYENTVPFENVKEYVDQFDFINVMTYDFTGGWDSIVEHNTPMSRIESSVKTWLSDGFPASKINVGLAFYGYLAKGDMKISALGIMPSEKRLFGRFKGDETDLGKSDEICDEGPIFSGVYKYKNLRKDILKKDFKSSHDGYTRYWDPVSKTPWLYNPESKNYITYDDPESLRVKLEYINANNLGGAMFWEAACDYNDELIDVIVSELKPKHKVLAKCISKSKV